MVLYLLQKPVGVVPVPSGYMFCSPFRTSVDSGVTEWVIV